MSSAADIVAKTIKSKTPEYRSWEAMKARCYNKHNIGYEHYGAKGVRVCARWLNSFDRFYEDMGPRPEGMTLDRKDVNGNYEPGNCRWATGKEQNNNATFNVVLKHDGREQTMSQWASELGWPVMTIHARINRLGWSVEKALTVTPRKRKS